MKLTFHSIAGQGDHSEERLQLNVVEKCDLVNYMIADTTYTAADRISNKVRHTHWFVPHEVNRGDAVVLYTKPGTASSTRRSDGSTVHFVYWGLNRAVWNDSGDGAVLFEFNTWSTKRVK